MTRRNPVAAVLLACLALAGCAGPTASLTIGGKAVALAVAFGAPPATVIRRTALPPAGVSSLPLIPVANGVGVLPVASISGPQTVVSTSAASSSAGASVGTGVRPPAAGRFACPALPVHASSREAAPSTAVGLPPAGSYRIVFSGEATQGRTSKRFSGIGVQRVSQGSTTSTGATSFEVTQTLLGAVSSYYYVVDPPTQSSSQSVSDGLIALSKVTGSGGLGYQASFAPDVPLELLTQPAFDGETWTGADSDVSSGTVAQVSGTVQAEKLVNACGAGIDTWQGDDTVTMTSPNENVTTNLQIFFATQYGGLPVAEVETYRGTAGGLPVSGTLRWVYAEDPGAGH